MSFKNIGWEVNKMPSGCWEWRGHIAINGYPGKVAHGGRRVSAHQAFYEKAKGSRVAPGKQIDHLCWNRSCVNPEHLRECTPAENCQNRILGKIDAEKAILMRQLSEKLGTPGWALAKVFCVSEATVSVILNRKQWRNV